MNWHPVCQLVTVVITPTRPSTDLRAATLAWGSLLAPVQVILPDDHIEAVVYGRRSFMVTICKNSGSRSETVRREGLGKGAVQCLSDIVTITL